MYSVAFSNSQATISRHDRSTVHNETKIGRCVSGVVVTDEPETQCLKLLRLFLSPK